MSGFPCPFERGSSREWPQGPREQTLKGRGSWDGQSGLFGALQVRLPPFLALCARGRGDRVQLWDSCPSWGGDVTVLTDTMPHLCPAPQALCPVSPRSGAGTVNKWQEARDEGERAPDHVPREAGLPGEEVEGGQACAGKPLLGVIGSHQGGHQPESYPLSPFPATVPTTPPPEEPSYAKHREFGNLRSALPPTPK